MPTLAELTIVVNTNDVQKAIGLLVTLQEGGAQVEAGFKRAANSAGAFQNLINSFSSLTQKGNEVTNMIEQQTRVMKVSEQARASLANVSIYQEEKILNVQKQAATAGVAAVQEAERKKTAILTSEEFARRSIIAATARIAQGGIGVSGSGDAISISTAHQAYQKMFGSMSLEDYKRNLLTAQGSYGISLTREDRPLSAGLNALEQANLAASRTQRGTSDYHYLNLFEQMQAQNNPNTVTHTNLSSMGAIPADPSLGSSGKTEAMAAAEKRLAEATEALNQAMENQQVAFKAQELGAELATLKLEKFRSTQMATDRESLLAAQAVQLSGEAAERVVERSAQLKDLEAQKAEASAETQMTASRLAQAASEQEAAAEEVKSRRIELARAKLDGDRQGARQLRVQVQEAMEAELDTFLARNDARRVANAAKADEQEINSEITKVRAVMVADQGLLTYLQGLLEQQAKMQKKVLADAEREQEQASVAVKRLKEQEAKEAEQAAQREQKAAQKTGEVRGIANLHLKDAINFSLQLAGIYGSLQIVQNVGQDVGTESRAVTGLTNLTHSAAQARAMVGELNDYSNHSQYGYDNLVNSARLMTSLGFAAKEVVPNIEAIGNAVMAAGGRPEGLDAIIAVLGRMQDEGQITVFTLKQIEREGIPAGQMLATALNESIVEVMKEVRNGTINAHGALELLISKMAESGRAAQASGDIYVLFAEIGNTLRNSLRELADQLLKTFNVRVGLQNTLDVLHALSDQIKDVLNVWGGGEAKLSSTPAVIDAVNVAIRLTTLALEALIALKVAAWISSVVKEMALMSWTQITLTAGTFLAVLAAIVAVDFAAWLYKNNETVRNAVVFVGGLVKAIQLLREEIGTAGFSDQPVIQQQEKTLPGDFMHVLDASATRGSVSSLEGFKKGKDNFDMAGTAISEQKALDMLNKTYLDKLAQQQDYAKRAEEIKKAMDDAYAAPMPEKTNYLSTIGNNIAQLLAGNIKDVLGSLMGNLDINKQMEEQRKKLANDQKKNEFNPASLYYLGEEKTKTLEQQIAKLQEEQVLLAATTAERKADLAIQKERQTIGEKVLENDARAQELLNQYIEAENDLVKLQKAAEISKGVGDAVANSFASFVDGAKTAKQAIRDLLNELEKLAVNEFVTKPLSQAISGNLINGFGVASGMPGQAGVANSLVGNVLSWFGLGTSAADAANYEAGITPAGGQAYASAGVDSNLLNSIAPGFANGGAFWKGVKMYADGDVFGTPTLFGMAGGNHGIMGEDGAEAVMPLARGGDGKLGVRMHGGGGGATDNSTTNHYHITQNIQTNDADSFRRSQRQIRQGFSGR